MFKNIGKSLKVIAKIFLAVSVAEVCFCIFTSLDDLPYNLVTYCFNMIIYFAISFALYGLGKIVEDISALKALKEKESFDIKLKEINKKDLEE
ncbi:MAG: hypothetical protein ACI4RN_08660 [Oscillospiraceae bacterium]